MNNNNFGKRLKELRKAKGFTQEVLAEKAGIDEKHLSRIENGKFFPTYQTLNRLMQALETSLDEVGLELEKVETNKSANYLKIMQIINNAKNEKELLCYLESLKVTQKAINLKD